MSVDFIFPKTRAPWLRFCLWLYGSIFFHIFVMGSGKHVCIVMVCVYLSFQVIQGHWFRYQSKVRNVLYFLLVISSNFGPILHRFGDTAAWRSKIANSYLASLSFNALVRGDPFRIRDEPDLWKNGHRAFDRWSNRDARFVRFDTINNRVHVIGRTDGQPDWSNINASIACHVYRTCKIPPVLFIWWRFGLPVLVTWLGMPVKLVYAGIQVYGIGNRY